MGQESTQRNAITVIRPRKGDNEGARQPTRRWPNQKNADGKKKKKNGQRDVSRFICNLAAAAFTGLIVIITVHRILVGLFGRRAVVVAKCFIGHRLFRMHAKRD